MSKTNIRRPIRAADHVGDYGDAFPHSTKVYVDRRHGMRVPMRRIALSGGEPPLASTTPAARSGTMSATACRAAARVDPRGRTSRTSGASRRPRATTCATR